MILKQNVPKVALSFKRLASNRKKGRRPSLLESETLKKSGLTGPLSLQSGGDEKSGITKFWGSAVRFCD